MRKLFIVCSLLMIFSPLFGWGQNSVFLAQSSAGSNNGTSCINAKAAASYFNSAGNWSGTPSGIQIGPDTTVTLCGTFSLSAGTSEYLAFQGSGTSGHPITLQCATNTTISAPYWSGNVIDLNGKNFLTLDGTNCTVSASDNGTTQTNHQNGACGICSAADVSNVNIVHWTISNLYIHACTGAGSTETMPCPTINDAQGDNNNAIQIWGGSNDTIAYNTIVNVHWGIVVYYGGSATNSTGIQVHHNSISNMDHGAILGDQGANSTITSSNCSSAYHDNDFSNTQNWDDNGNNFHHDGIHAWANNTPGSHYSGVCFYNNHFHGGWGWHPSGLLTSESLGNTNYFFNNLIGNLGGNTYCADGLMTHFTGTGSNGTNQIFVNNTIDPGSTPCSTGVASDDNSGTDFGNTQATGTVSKNNLFMSNQQTYVHSSSGSIGSSDYNVYGLPAGANPFYGTCGGGVSFSTWKSGCGFDTRGLNAVVSINSDYTLPNGSVAVAAGTNLTSLGITALSTGAPQTFGVTGTCGTGCIPRSAIGAWDVGAYPITAQACTSISINVPPTIAPFSGLIGAGTLVRDPEPVPSGCFHNPILRVTDANTGVAACTAQSQSCPGKANESNFANSSDGEDSNWSIDDLQFSTIDDGSTAYIFNFDPINLTSSVRYINFNTIIPWYIPPAFSHTTAKKVYSFSNSAGNAHGTMMSSYDTSTTFPTLPTRTSIKDFATAPNGISSSAIYETDAVSINNNDTIFLTGFSTINLQGTGIYVASYKIGSGLSVWNTNTSTITGDYGTTGTIQCQNCGGPTDPGHFTLHGVKMSPDGLYAIVTPQGTCATTCYNGQSPYIWQIGTTNVWTQCGTHCGGHGFPGYTGFITENNTSFYTQKPYTTLTNNVFPASYCSGVATPFDGHGSWWNNSGADQEPFFVSTTAANQNPSYTFCTVGEIISISPPTNIALSGTVSRYAHNYGAATSQFAVQNQITTISQGKSGRLFATMTSPMANSSTFIGQLGDTSGGFPCTVQANCRGDVFVVQLKNNPKAQAQLFGFTENNTSPGNFPTVTYKMQRIWDSPPLQWPSINTSNGVFNFTSLDTMLAQDFSNGVSLVMYTLARTPPWATSQPTDTTCNYQLPAVGGGHGECYAPNDLNADGSGTDAIWKAWITALASHANNPAYLVNHAHIKYWEIWNEPDNKPFWAGTFAQLSRMTEDANCIITGRGVIHPNGNGTSVTCAATPIDATAQIVMSSGHAATAPALQYAQNQLYCNNIGGVPAYELPCPNPANATAAALDIINFHMKPGVTSTDVEGNFATYVTSINNILQFPENTKPLWDGETSYSSTGFSAPYNDPDMAASLMPRMYLTMLTNNITGSAWYTWDQIAAQNIKVAVSYQQTYNYLNGSTLSPMCTAIGTVWTCGLINGSTSYLILWDTSQVCSGGICPTGPVSVPVQWGFYQDMTSVSTPTAIVSNTVPVGIKPVILTVGSGSNPIPFAPSGLMDIIQ